MTHAPHLCAAVVLYVPQYELRPTAWPDALEFLRSRGLEELRRAFPDRPHLLRASGVSVDDLPPDDRECYLDLAEFPEDAAIPEGPQQVLRGLTPAKTRACVDRPGRPLSGHRSASLGQSRFPASRPLLHPQTARETTARPAHASVRRNAHRGLRPEERHGGPIQQSIAVNDHEVTFYAVDVAATRLDNAGHVDAFPAGCLKFFCCGGLTIKRLEPLEVALWREVKGQ